MGYIRIVTTVAFLGLLMVIAVFSHAEILGNYAGYKACIECHEEIVDGWKTTPHANAFETLKEQGEEKQSIPGCFRCHVVGYDADGGFVDMNLTPELKDVQCEACHGPALKHVESGGDPELLLKKADEKACRVCHTEGQDKNFDFESKKRWVHQSPEGSEKTIKKYGKPEQGLFLSETKVAFGNMVEGDTVNKSITLTNKGKTTVVITNVTTSCACTTTTLNERELQPGQSARMIITYHTYKFPDKFQKYVTISTDDSKMGKYEVEINGYVEPIPMGVLEVNPRKLALGDQFKAGSAVPFVLKIKNSGDADMKITGIESKKGKILFLKKIFKRPGSFSPEKLLL